MQKASISGDIAITGGSFYLDGESSLTISQINASNNIATKEGGLMYISDAVSDQESLTLASSIESKLIYIFQFNIHNITAFGQGGIFFIDNPHLNITLKEGNMTDLSLQNGQSSHTQYQNGLMIQFERISALILEQVSFTLVEIGGNRSHSYISGGSEEVKANLVVTDCSFQSSNQITQTNPLDFCIQAEELGLDNAIQKSHLFKILEADLLSESNSFIGLSQLHLDSVFYLTQSDFSDIFSTYDDIYTISSTIIKCEMCGFLSINNLQLGETSSCFGKGGLLSLNEQVGNISIMNLQISHTSNFEDNHAIHLTQTSFNPIDVDIQNITHIDEGEIFEMGIISFADQTLVQNIKIQNIKIQKKELLSVLLNVGVTQSLLIQNMQISLQKDMKSRRINEDYINGLINITSFTELEISQIKINCSDQEADFEQMITGKNLNNEYFPNIYNPLFALWGSESSSQNQINLKDIWLQNCYNFYDGVVVQSFNAQNITISESVFNHITKIPDYQGGRSGLFQFDFYTEHIYIMDTLFHNILTEGNMITEVDFNMAAIAIFNCSFYNVHSTLRKGGIISSPPQNLIYQELFFLDIDFFKSQVRETYLYISTCEFQNISSDQDGAIIYQIPQTLRQMLIENSYFFNITSKKAGAILKQDGKDFYSQKFANLTIKRSYALQGGVIDLDYMFDKHYSEYLNVECFPPDFEYLQNPLENRMNFVYEPGPFWKIKKFKNSLVMDHSYYTNCITFGKGAVVSCGVNDNEVWGRFCVYSLNSTFINNTAFYGGVISIDQGDIVFEQGTFINNQAISGGAIFIGNPVWSAGLFYLNVIGNKAQLKGGFMAMSQLQPNEHNLRKFDYSLDNSYFDSNSAKYGGVASFEVDFIQLFCDGCTLVNNSAEEKGGCIYFYQGSQINIIYSDIFMNYAKSGSIAYVFALNSKTEGYDDPISWFYSIIMDCEGQSINSPFVLLNPILGISYNDIWNCVIEDGTSLFQIINSNYTYGESNVFKNISGGYGSVIKVIGTPYFRMDSSDFLNNTAIQGGVVYMQQVIAYLNYCQISGNKATDRGGVAYISSNTSLSFYGSTIQENSADEGAFIYSVGSNDRWWNMVTSSTVKGHRSRRATFVQISGYLYFQDSVLEDNFGEESTHGVLAINTWIYFINTICKFSNPGFGQNLTVKSDLAGFAKLSMSILIANDSQFINGFADRGGALYISSKSWANITSSYFYNNLAFSEGGAIYAKITKAINIQDCIFEDNLSYQKGDEFFISLSIETFLFMSSTIRNFIGEQFIYAEKSILKIQSSLIESQDLENLYSKNNIGTIQLINCDSFEIVDTAFKNLSSAYGGALYIEETQVNIQNKEQMNEIEQQLISNCIFENCRAFQGGAIFLKNSYTVLLSNNMFHNNTAFGKQNNLGFGKGGAIYYTNYGASDNTKLIIDTQNSFKSNKAEAGGGIFWDKVEPLLSITDEDLTQSHLAFNEDQIHDMFEDNSVTFYGDDIASIAQKIIYDQESSSSIQATQFGLDLYQDEFRSGEVLPTFKLKIVDIYDQVIKTDNQTIVRLSPNATFNTNPNALLYLPIIEGQSSFIADQGIISISNIYFYGAPEFNHSLNILTNAIDLETATSVNLLQELNALDLSAKLIIYLRACKQGEQFTPSGKCEYCSQPTFSIEEMKEPGVCLTCPDEAICFGGAQIGPKQGYWRANASSLYFQRCINQDACLGIRAPNYNLIGDCQEGYQGILCSSCQEQYFRYKIGVCQKCPHPALTYFKIIFAIIGFIFLCLMLIRKVLSLTKSTQSDWSIEYFKQLFGHFQLLMITYQLEKYWPSILTIFAQEFTNVATVSSLYLNFECLIDKNEGPTFFGRFKQLFSINSISITFLPALTIFLLIIFWILYGSTRKVSISRQLPVSILVVTYLFYPSIIYRTFSIIHYRIIDSIPRVQSDLEIAKYSQEHLYLIYFALLPSLIIWIVGIPLAWLAGLYFQRRDIEDRGCSRSTIGFLLMGLKKKYYTWEIVIAIRNSFLIYIIAAISDWGGVIQSMIVVVIYIIFLFLTIHGKPYNHKSLHRLSILSLTVQIFTIYFGLFLIVEKPEEWILKNRDKEDQSLNLQESAKYFFIIVILMLNMFYFGYWLTLYIISMRKIIKMKWSKMYSLIFKAKFQSKPKVKSSDLIDSQNELVLMEEYSLLVSRIKKFYSSKDNLINKKSLTALRRHFERQRLEEFIQNHSKIKQSSNQLGIYNQSKQYLEVQTKKTMRSKVSGLNNMSTMIKDNISDQGGRFRRLRTKNYSSLLQVNNEFVFR